MRCGRQCPLSTLNPSTQHGHGPMCCKESFREGTRLDLSKMAWIVSGSSAPKEGVGSPSGLRTMGGGHWVLSRERSWGPGRADAEATAQRGGNSDSVRKRCDLNPGLSDSSGSSWMKTGRDREDAAGLRGRPALRLAGPHHHKATPSHTPPGHLSVLQSEDICTASPGHHLATSWDSVPRHLPTCRAFPGLGGHLAIGSAERPGGGRGAEG